MRKIKNTESGQSIVELAIAIPILLILILGIFDFGRAFYSYLTLEHASREAARYASIRADGGDIEKVKEKAVEWANGVNVTKTNVGVKYTTAIDSANQFVEVSFYNYTMDFYNPILIALNPFMLPSLSTTMRVEAGP